MKTFKKLYQNLKIDYLKGKISQIPEKYQSSFVCLCGASDVHFEIGRVLTSDANVLLIGDFGGREYYYLKTRGNDVTVLDLSTNKDFENQVVGNIEEPFPFPDKTFDGVIICGVLEHIRKDYEALINIRNTLKDDGIFILRVPIMGESEETHLQIYTRVVLKRFLKAAGFKIQDCLEYPNLFFYPPLINLSHHFLNAIYFLIFKKTFYNHSLPFLWKIEHSLGKSDFLIVRIWRKTFGFLFPITRECHVSCRKIELFDYIDYNKKMFEHAATEEDRTALHKFNV